jgi:hypothetical protein
VKEAGWTVKADKMMKTWCRKIKLRQKWNYMHMFVNHGINDL